MRDALLALPLVVLAASCSYDWRVGPPAADGGDAAFTADVTTRPDGPADAPADGPADASIDSPPVDAPEEPLPACNVAQEAAVQLARAKALDCTGVTPMPCQVSLKDECGCPVYAAAANNAEAQYAAAIKQMQMTCVPLCPTTCGPAPSPGVCIVTDAGSGALACHQ